tara:strand:+ start:342 stop:509 length:168 start_codon:yes stop_codon:yes gene_type:complete
MKDLQQALKEYTSHDSDQRALFDWLKECPYEVKNIRQYAALEEITIDLLTNKPVR